MGSRHDGNLVSAFQAWSLRYTASDGNGPSYTVARSSAGERSLTDECVLLRAASLRSFHPYGSYPGLDAGTGICVDSWDPQPRPSGGLAARHRSSTHGRRLDLSSALARGPY